MLPLTWLKVFSVNKSPTHVKLGELEVTDENVVVVFYPRNCILLLNDTCLREALSIGGGHDCYRLLQKQTW